MKLTIITTVEIDVETIKDGELTVRKVYGGIWDLIPEHRQPTVTATLFAANGTAMRTINRSTQLRSLDRPKK